MQSSGITLVTVFSKVTVLSKVPLSTENPTGTFDRQTFGRQPKSRQTIGRYGRLADKDVWPTQKMP